MAGCGAGEVTIESVKDRYPIQDYQTGDWGYINEKGEVVIEPKYKSAYNFSNGLARISLENEDRQRLTGYVNQKGNIVIEPQFIEATDFHEGLAKVRTPESDKKKISFYIDTRGKKVFEVEEYKFKKIHFSEGLAPFYQNGKWGFVDKKGNIVIPNKFSGVSSFSEGLAVVRIGPITQNKNGYIDRTGEFVIEPNYARTYSFSDGLALVSGKHFTSKMSIINLENQIIGKVTTYSHCSVEEGYSEGLIGACFDVPYDPKGRFKITKCAFLNKEGEIAIKPKFDKVKPFQDGLAAVMVDKKWGFIDSTGEFVIEPEYDSVSSFKNGLAKVEKNPLLPSAYIDKENNIVWKKIDY